MKRIISQIESLAFAPVTTVLSETGMLDETEKTVATGLSRIGDVIGGMILLGAVHKAIPKYNSKTKTVERPSTSEIAEAKTKAEYYNEKFRPLVESIQKGETLSEVQINKFFNDMKDISKDAEAGKEAMVNLLKSTKEGIGEKFGDIKEEVSGVIETPIEKPTYTVKKDATGKFAVTDEQGTVIKHFDTEAEAKEFAEPKAEVPEVSGKPLS